MSFSHALLNGNQEFAISGNYPHQATAEIGVKQCENRRSVAGRIQSTERVVLMIALRIIGIYGPLGEARHVSAGEDADLQVRAPKMYNRGVARARNYILEV